MHHELPVELVEIGRGQFLAPRLEAALDQRPGARADHVACLGDGNGREALLLEDDIEGPHEVTGRIGQGAIEIEDSDGRGDLPGMNGHGARLPAQSKGINPRE